MTRRLSDDEKAVDKRRRRETTATAKESRPELPLIEAIAGAMERSESRRVRKLSYRALAQLAIEVMEEMAAEALRE